MTHQFDVFKNPRDKVRFPYLLLVQHDVLSTLPVRVVVPLTPQAAYGDRPIARLNPVFRVEGVPVVMLTQLLGAIAPGSLGRRVATLDSKRSEIIAALDIVFSGI
ncbi:MAG: CcdB family protein [Myxococcota bacterium]